MSIIPRSVWGGPVAAIGHLTAGAKLLAVIHHSYRPDRACGATKAQERADMLGMHRYHAGQGWGGIGYNFLVTQSGNRYEGRGWGRTGAHTAGRNSSSVGICLVIDGSRHAPTPAAVEAVEAIIAEGVRLDFIAPAHRRAPHDEFAAKVCPGELVKPSGILGGRIPQVERTDAAAAMPTLRLGKGGIDAPADIREAVRELQRRLDMPDQYRTGYFGEITDRYVRDAQRARGLTIDGIVGPRTWAALGI